MKLRFVCDHNVDARVAGVLTSLGHDAWTADQAGLNEASDDTLTVYACNQNAILLTHDREFSQRRRKNVVGRHIYLRCHELEAAELLKRHLNELLPVLASAPDLYVALSSAGMVFERNWT